MTNSGNYTQLPINLLKQVSFDANPNQSNFTTPTEENKPKMINVISNILFIFAIENLYYTLATFGINLIFLRLAMSAYNIPYYSKIFLSLGPIAILSIIPTLTFFYLAFKIRQGSRFSYWLTLFSLLIIPILFTLTINALITPFNNIFNLPNNELYISVANLVKNFRFEPLYIITLVLLIFSYKKFHFTNSKLTKKVRLFLTILAILLIVPIISIMSFIFIQASDTDHGYTTAQSQVNYHIYKPTIKDYVVSTVYKRGLNYVNKNNAVAVTFDLPLGKIAQEKNPIFIVLKEVGIEPGFDLNQFTSKFTKTDPNSQEFINLNNALNNQAYSGTQVKGKMRELVFVTKDNVLIYIIGTTTKDELIQFAESLK